MYTRCSFLLTTNRVENAEVCRKCQYCAFETTSSLVLLGHFSQHFITEALNWLKCGSCDYRTKIQDDFLAHILRTHSDKAQCDICKAWMSKIKLKIHKLIAHSEKEKTYPCSICDRVFSSKHLLESHSFIHRQRHEFPEAANCEYCSYHASLLSNPDSHNKHKLIEWHDCAVDRKQKRLQWHECNLCQFVTSDKSLLVTHKSTHRQPEDVSYTCPFCEQGFKKKYLWRDHVQTKNCLKLKNKCIPCELGFPTRAALKTHIENNGCLQERCGLCNRKFKCKNNLRNHVRNKVCLVVKCVPCNRKFKTKAGYKSHRRKTGC